LLDSLLQEINNNRMTGQSPEQDLYMAILRDHFTHRLSGIAADPRPEFGFDEERHLFEYNPLDSSDYLATSYQRLLTATDMMFKLLGAWKKRRSKSGQQVNDYEDLDLDFTKNLYQMEQENRIKLRSDSVLKVLEIFEGENEIEKLTDKVSQAVTFLKKVLTLLVGRCLPMALPFPVMSTIISHLIREEGLHNVGFVGEEDEKEGELVEAGELPELRDMTILYDNIAHVYTFMRDIMFNNNRLVRMSIFSKEGLRQKKEEVIKGVDDLMGALGNELDGDKPVE